MDLRRYYDMARKWWWLLVLCTLLGGGAAYLVSNGMTRIYEASTLIMIGTSLDVVNPTTGEIATSEKLAQTYAELVKTDLVLNATADTLGLPKRPKVTVTLLRNTQLMRITVADSRPERAATTANELARQLILQSPSAPQRQEQTYREFVNAQLEELQQDISTLGKAVMAAQANGTDQETLVRMQTELNLRRASYSSLLAYIKDSSANFIRVIEAAQVPTRPVSPKVLQNSLLAAIVGLMLAAGGAFLIEYLDDSIKSQEEAERMLDLPTLGTIALVTTNGVAPGPITLAHPKSSFSEGYRMLRTNLRYSVPASTPQRTFLITSAGPGEGKSTISTNLGIVMAQAGQRTILVDADLRRPTLHKHFACPNDVGLTSLLVGETSLEAALRSTAVEGLSLLTSGPIPPNAAELLGSPRMAELLLDMSQRADVILLDSPPVLAVTDASILSGLVTGSLLVLQVGETRLDACVQSLEALKRVGGNVLGLVLNRLNPKSRGYYYSYHQYYSSGEDTKGDGHQVDAGLSPETTSKPKSHRRRGLRFF